MIWNKLFCKRKSRCERMSAFGVIITYTSDRRSGRCWSQRPLWSLFYEIQYQACHTAVYPQKSLSDNIKKYIISTVFRNITVHDIAVHFGLSDDYVTQLFYKYEHITPKAYINQLKIKKIEEYLISTNTSLQAIAKKLSFPNVSALSKFYKYHTGRTITQYRTKFINWWRCIIS